MIKYSKDKYGLQDYIEQHREEKGEVRMCIALDEMIKDGKMRGFGEKI